MQQWTKAFIHVARLQHVLISMTHIGHIHMLQYGATSLVMDLSSTNCITDKPIS